MPRQRPGLTRILASVFVGVFGIPAFFAFLSYAASPSPYRLGPTLEEYETLMSSDTATTTNADPETSFPQPQERAPSKQFNQQEWNKMRRSLEDDRDAPGVLSKPVVSSTGTVEPPKPPPGQIYVELPYESSLSVTGRKVIRVDLKNTHITGERARETGQAQDSQSFDMQQELQARIQGTVARKTTINVNFDDTRENVRDFSVIYKGDPEELVQEAAFGDLVLSLPSTEFVNYNKQLFGIRTQLKYKNLGFTAIGSRTKGTTETKRFVGATKRQQVFVNDVSYIRYKYFDLTFPNSPAMSQAGGPFDGQLPLLPLTDGIPEVVYLEDTTGILSNAQNYTVALATDPATSTQIRMRILSRGIDYSIDRIEGVITFINPIKKEERVAIDFAIRNGQKISDLVSAPGAVAVLLKDKNDEVPTATQEIKRFYSVGFKNIVRDNGLGNFLLKIYDKDRQNEIGDSLGLSYVDKTIEMNFDTGIFKLDSPLPYSDIYEPSVSQAAPLHAVFSVEFNGIVRTFNLRPNIVLQSEVVEIDGRRVNRDLDYFIDYDVGIITFFNDDLIRESTSIEVTYEFAPFGGQLGETLVGARTTYDVLQNVSWGGMKMGKWAVGSSVLYNFAAKPTSLPDIRSTPSSMLVLEGDTQVKGLKIPGLPFVTNLSVEAARSQQDPNIYDRAIVDSMEGIKQEDTSSMLRDAWQVGANPDFGTYNRVSDFRLRDNADSHIRWDEIDVTVQNEDGENVTQKALNLSYSLNTSNTTDLEQVSIVNALSFSGRDFSKKNSIEVELEGAGSAAAGQDVDLIVEYGTFNEDADGDGILDSEDINPQDGILNLGEDIGWAYRSSGPDLDAGTSDDLIFRIGAGNARMDSEDLDNNKAFNTQDFPATNSPLFQLSRGYVPVGGGPVISDLSFSGRRLFQIPINLSSLSEDEKSRLQAVKQVRLTFRSLAPSGPGTARAGNIRIIRVSAVGNTWDNATVTNLSSTMTVKAINNKDDAIYSSLLSDGNFRSLYRDSIPASDAREQALSFDYDLLAGATGYSINKFTAPRDLSKHKHLKMFVRRYGTGGTGGRFFFQAGSDTEYQQLSIPVTSIPETSWLLIDLEQKDTNSDGTPETWVSNTPDVTVTMVGNAPNLVQVAQFKAGVYNDSGAAAQQQIWLNEIHQTDSNERIGYARKYSFDSNWDGWMDFSGDYRNVDRNWQTPTTQITNQDNSRAEGRLNFTRLSFLPLNFTTSKEITKTPSAFRSNTNALVSFLQEGRVESTNHTASGKLLVPKFPILDFGFRTNEQDNNTTLRTQTDTSANVGISYTVPVSLDVLPGKSFTFRPLPATMSLIHTRKITKLRYRDYSELVTFGISTAPFSSTNLDQLTNENEARMSFKFWDGFSFNPSYRLAVAKEVRNFREDELDSAPQTSVINDHETPRSVAQNVSASGSLRLTKWLEPNYNYSLSGTETNNLPTLTNTTAYMLKDIVRNSQAEVSATVQLQRILKTSKLFQTLSLTPNYKAENGDSYKDMPEGYSWRGKFWAGTPLVVSSGTDSLARRVSASDKRTFRLGTSWLPFTAYSFQSSRIMPLSTLSLTHNFSSTLEKREETGTRTRIESRTFPDLIVTVNNVEDMLGIKRVVEDSRLTLKDNVRKDETLGVSKRKSEAYSADYQFKLLKKWDIATSYNIGRSREDNLVTNTLTNKTDTTGYSVQTRIPKGPWAYTPRYEHNQTDSRDSVRVTNDLRVNIYSLQIYGDLTKPIGLRFGRKEIDFANRFILNSTVKWEQRRSNINPSTNFLDIYSATMSGDYTLSKNFRLALGGNFAQEKHHSDFNKLDQMVFGVNSTLTIQF